MQKTRPNPIICAIDTTDIEKAKQLAGQIRSYVGAIKLGLEFFTYNGTAGVKALEATGIPIFLDLKFHDIPNTVARTVRALNDLNVFMFTVHASGGRRMMEDAAEACHKSFARRPLMVGVTVLTSLNAEDLKHIGIIGSPQEQALRLAALAKDAGLDGIVCSPHEIINIRERWPKNFALVVPGIRRENYTISEALAGKSTNAAFINNDDQKRTMTPKNALANGADFLVIGRPITEAKDPGKAASEIFESLEAPQ